MQKILRQISPQTILAAFFVLSISLFSVVTLFPSLFYHKLDPASYLVFHNGAELFGVIVCMSIFGVGWYTYEQSNNRHALFLSGMFLGIGLLGFMHTLSFPGMPQFITPNSTDKGIQFWLTFRLFYAGALLVSAYVYADTRNRWLAKTSLLVFSAAVSILVFTAIIYYPSYLPIWFIEGKRLTPFKTYAEYAIIGLLVLSFVAYWKRFSKTHDKLLMFYLSALVLSIFSELAFTLYQSAFDTYNMLGHIFEVGAFYLIYKGIFAASVVYPYERLQDTSRQLDADIIRRKTAEKELHRLNRELQAISNCNQILLRAEDEQTLLNEICRIICDEAGYRLAWVGYAEKDDAKTIRPVAWNGFDSGYIADTKLSWADDTERGQGPAGTVIRSGETIYVQDFTIDPRMAPWRESALQRGYRSGIALPLKDERANVFGVLLVYAAKSNAFTPAEIRLMEELADDLAFGINGLRARIERKKTKEALESSEERYKAVVENIQIGISLINPSMEIIEINNVFRQYFPHVRPGSGQICYEQYNDPPRSEPCSYCPCILTFQDGRVHEAITETPAGPQMRNYHVVSSPIKDSDGRIQFVIELVEDITERKRFEKSLQDSEERLRMTLEASQIGIWDWDVKADQWCASPIYYTMLGYEPNTGLGDRREWLERVHPDDRAFVKERIQNVLAGDSKEYQYEARLRHADGSYRWQHVRGMSVKRDEAGKVTRMLGIRMDIGQRKRAEEALQAASKYDRSLIEASLDPLVTISAEGKITDVNAGTERVTGYSREELIGTDFADYFTDPEKARTGYRTVFRDGLVKDYELEIRHRDGGLTPVMYNASVYRDESEKIVGVFAAARDISDRIRAEERNALLAAIVESSDDAIIGKTLDGIITSWNKGAANIYGYQDTEVLGKPISILVPPDRHDEVPLLLERARRGEHVEHYETVRRKKDGRDSDVSLTVSPITNAEGGIVGASTIARDISEQKSLQRQLLQAQKMEAVGTLAGGIAHDFNNILQVVLGYSELALGDEALTGRLRDDLGKVHQAGKTGADLVQRLLMFSRKTEPKPLYLDLNQRIRQTQKFLQRTIPKMIDIETVLAEDLGSIHADPTQMDQVLMNLAVNARDAMPEGGKLVIETANVVIDEDYARSHLDANSGTYVLLSVSDTGSGMDKETLKHIFEPFFTTKGLGQGTGLGLAMVFGIVKQHHGFINCYSEVGHGTTFKVYLPAVIAETRSDEPVVTPMPRGGTETILLVDDEEFVRDLGKRILERSGYTVLSAANGKEALKLHRREREKISLVILDLIMPEMGGKQCLEKLLKIAPKARVLIASGFAANGQTKEAIETGARGFVAKPYDIRQMLQAVREVLDSNDDR